MRLPCSQMSRKTSDGRRLAISASADVGVTRRARAVALVRQDAGDEVPDVGFVVDDEDIRCHDRSSVLDAAAATRSGLG